MAKRGPKAQSEGVKALRGNPGMRRLNLEHPEELTVTVPLGVNQFVQTGEAAIPDFVNRPRERAAFKTTIEDFLQRRVARTSDLPAYGRYAVYLEMFCEVKDKVIKQKAHLSEDGARLMRTLKDLEEMLSKLEGNLGLNPLARQQIIRTLSTVPQTKLIEEQAMPPKKDKTPTEPESPLAFLAVAK